MRLYDKKFWIFDLDGTLTVPVHDFDQIKRMLGLKPDRGILESLADLDNAAREPLLRLLDDHEYELAQSAIIAPGAAELLEDLTCRNIGIGILTRNNRRNLERTLERIGLSKYVAPATVRTRENTKPKPHPDGILQLLAHWGAQPSQAVMVGNHHIDVETGRAAGIATVFVDPGAQTNDSNLANLTIRTLLELTPRRLGSLPE